MAVRSDLWKLAFVLKYVYIYNCGKVAPVRADPWVLTLWGRRLVPNPAFGAGRDGRVGRFVPTNVTNGSVNVCLPSQGGGIST